MQDWFVFAIAPLLVIIMWILPDTLLMGRAGAKNAAISLTLMVGAMLSLIPIAFFSEWVTRHGLDKPWILIPAILAFFYGFASLVRR